MATYIAYINFPPNTKKKNTGNTVKVIITT